MSSALDDIRTLGYVLEWHLGDAGRGWRIGGWRPRPYWTLEYPDAVVRPRGLTCQLRVV